MDKDSEVTADNYRPEDMKFRKKYRNTVYFTEKRRAKIADGFGDTFTGGITIVAGTVVDGLTYYYTGGIGYFLIKGTTTSAYVVGGNRALTGLAKIGNGIFGSEVREDTLNPIRDMISPKYQDYYDGYESATMFVVGEAATFANKLNTNNLNKGSQINTSFREQKTPISSTKSLAGGKNYNAIKEISQGKVFINDGTPGGTTIAHQIRATDSSGSMRIFQENLTTGEISLQKINPLGQRISETSFTPYEANTLIGANSSSKMLVGNGAVSQSVISRVSYQTGNNSLVLYDKTPVPVTTNRTLVPPLTTNKELATVPLVTNGAVSQVASKVGQVQNNRLPYKPVLALPVKYPIKSKSGVTIYKDYAIGSRGAKYIEVGVSNNKEIVYKNSNGSYFKLTDKGLENISSKDVIKKEYFPTVKVQKNNGSNPSAGKNYYVSKEGNFKVEKYIEAGQTVEDYDKIYLIENVRARGINVGRSKEHTNTTISHWEKAVDIADEAKVDPNVKAVYVDETLKNISDKFKDSDARPDVTIEYKDGTFKLIEVQSKTDYEPNLKNKLKNIQNEYGKDVVKEYDVKKPKGGK